MDTANPAFLDYVLMLSICDYTRWRE